MLKRALESNHYVLIKITPYARIVFESNGYALMTTFPYVGDRGIR